MKPLSCNPPARVCRFLILALFLASSCRRSDRLTPDSGTPEIIKTKSGAEMVLIPAGWFTMGSDRGEADEQPARKVRIDAFLIDRFEVTQEQFRKCKGKDSDAHFKGNRNPVENISWPVAALYCNARSRIEDLQPCYDEETGACDFEADGYRLPSEAEWEYACRAGSDGEYSFGVNPRRLKRYAWFRNNSAKRTHPVGSRKPNPWGIYDLHGNVSEWCNDVYDAGYYKRGSESNPRGPPDSPTARFVVRGGAWNSSANACRSAYRAGEAPGQIDGCFAHSDIGFRCIRALRDRPEWH